jgi:HSP20 family molecular chaperone IbpA
MADKKGKLQSKKEQSSMETESTRNRKIFIPPVDIMEKDNAIVLFGDMPGVDEKSVDITLEKNILTITGTIEPEQYKDYRIAYAEYNIGDYRRSFTISDTIDQDNIKATVKNGMLTLTLPKAEPAKAKKIEVKAL